jgi:hypothetical protein
MELAPYSEFGRLRLKEFCPEDKLYNEDIDEHGVFIKEEIRGVWFARWRKRPDELFVITVHLDDCSTNVVRLLFPKLGLELMPGTSRAETDALFGTPQWQRADGGLVRYRTGGDSPYEVSCGFGDGCRLSQVSVRRLDIQIPHDE